MTAPCKPANNEDSRRGSFAERLAAAYALSWRDPEDAVRVASGLIAEARELGDAQTEIEAWGILGSIRTARADYEGTLDLLHAASENLAIFYGITRLPSEFLNGMGCAYYHLGYPSTAIAFLIDAKRTMCPLASARSRAGTFNNLGLAMQYLGDAKAAERELRSALAVLADPRDAELALLVRLNLAYALRLSYTLDELKPEYTAILEASAKLNALVPKAIALRLLAQAQYAEGNWRVALDLNAEAWSIDETLGYYAGLIASQEQRARILLDSGEPADALAVLDKGFSNPAATVVSARAGLVKIKAAALESLGMKDEASSAWEEHGVLEERNQAALHSSMRILEQKTGMLRAHSLIFDFLAKIAGLHDGGEKHTVLASRCMDILCWGVRNGDVMPMDVESISVYSAAARIHDIGMFRVSKEILTKKGALTEGELAVVQTHVEDFLALFDVSEWGTLDPRITRLSMEVISGHHERWDGTGYPKGLAGDDIPLGGRLMAIVDTYVSMRSHRPYRAALSHDEARACIAEGAGILFDPALCRVFERCADDMERVYAFGTKSHAR